RGAWSGGRPPRPPQARSPQPAAKRTRPRAASVVRLGPIIRDGRLPQSDDGFALRGALVHAVDDGLVLLLDDAPLHLERRRELARFQRELAGEERDLLDALELRAVGGEVLHEPLVVLLDRGKRHELLAGLPGETFLARPGLELLEVRDHERGGEVAAVARHHHPRPQGGGLGAVLAWLGRGVLVPPPAGELLLFVRGHGETLPLPA